MSNKKLDDSKRKLLKSAAVGGGAASLIALPKKWTHPVVASVVLPAHAEQSDTSGSLGSIENCPAENTYTEIWSGQETYCQSTASVVNRTQIYSGSDGTCLDGSPFNYSVTLSENVGAGTMEIGFSFSKYCGPTHVAEGVAGFKGTYSGAGTCGTNSRAYTGSKYGNFNYCSLLAPEDFKGSKLKAAVQKSMAKRTAK